MKVNIDECHLLISRNHDEKICLLTSEVISLGKQNCKTTRKKTV